MSDRQTEVTLEPWEVEARLNRQRLAEALRHPDAVQCIGQFGAWTRSSGPVCLYGMALRLFTTDEQKATYSKHDDPFMGYLLKNKLALSLDASGWHITRNDHGWTFHELAGSILEAPYVNPNT